MNSISRETFEGMDSDSKLNVLFDFAAESHKKIHSLEKKFDARKRIDTVFSGFMGLVGGGLAFLGSKLFK